MENESPPATEHAPSEIAVHYGVALGHLVGGALLFLAILTIAIYVGVYADWLVQGREVDPVAKILLVWVKRIALAIDSLLFIATGIRAVSAVWKA